MALFGFIFGKNGVHWRTFVHHIKKQGKKFKSHRALFQIHFLDHAGRISGILRRPSHRHSWLPDNSSMTDPLYQKNGTLMCAVFLVTRRGFEPRTHCLKGSCSANWASGSKHGWDGRIWTDECQSQSLVPYRLATSQYLTRHDQYYSITVPVLQSLFWRIHIME